MAAMNINKKQTVKFCDTIKLLNILFEYQYFT